MKSLTILRYKQPLESGKWNIGVRQDSRDTFVHRLAPSTINGMYRRDDPKFHRTRTLDTFNTPRGLRSFYRERVSFRVSIPFVGGLVEKFFK